MYYSTTINIFLDKCGKVTRVKSNFLFVLCSLLLFSATAQDTIFKTDSAIIQAKVTEVGDETIKYKKFNNLDGPIYNIKKTDVRIIVYQNGEKEIYNSIQTEENIKPFVELKKEPHVAVDSSLNKPSVIIKDSSSLLQPPTNQEATSPPTAPAPIAVDGNYDFIALVNGDNINCIVDVVDNTTIFYHIKKRGFDPNGKIPLAHVTKYFYRQQWHDGNGNASDSAKVVVKTRASKNHIMQENVALVYTLPKVNNTGIGGFLRINYTYKNNIVWGVGLGIFHKKFTNEDFAANISNWSLIPQLLIGYQIALQKLKIIPTAGLFWGGVRQKATGDFDIPAAYAADIGYFGELKLGYNIGETTMIYLSGAYYNNFNNYSGHFFKATPLSAGILFKL